jgi:hypothetical protein
MLLGSGRPAEAAEWDWLGAALKAEEARPIGLFLHKPPFLIAPDEPDDSSAAMPVMARMRFWELIRQHNVRLIGSGHRHEHRCVLADGVLTVWAPTTSGLLDETTPPLPPVAFAGAIEYAFVAATVMHRVIPFAGGGHDL